MDDPVLIYLCVDEMENYEFLKVLEKAGVPIDMIVGTSIGGLVGGIISGTNDNAVVFKNCTNNGNILLPDATGSINNVGGLIGTSFDSNFAVNIQSTNTNFNGSILIGEQTATSIQKTSVDCDNVSIYDLSGRKLNKPKKGINIINGKKVLIK